MNVAIYCRVSTLEQVEHGYSIEEQKYKLKTFCEINDWDSYKIFTDYGFSGSNTKRPELQEMMNNIEKFDLVLVYKLDRLTRNVRDLLDLLDTFEKHDVAFRSATEVYDTSSAMGRLFVTLVGAMAEWERSTITERTIMGRKASLKNGNYVGKKPFYMDKLNGILKPNEKAEVVRYIKDLLLKGYSLRATALNLNASKYQPPIGNEWLPSTVKRIITNPVICGHTRYGEELIKNTHEKIISLDDYKAIQKRIGSRTNTLVHKHNAIFRGKLRCHICDRKLSLKVKNQNNTNKKTIRRYHCSECARSKEVKNSPTFLEAEIERVFIDYIQKLDTEDFVLKNKNENDKDNVIDIVKIKNQRAKYQRAWSNEYITDEEFEERMKETQKLMDLYYNANQVEENKEFDIEEINAIKNKIQVMWSKLNIDKKEEFISQFIKEIDYTPVLSKNPGSAKDVNSIVIENINFY